MARREPEDPDLEPVPLPQLRQVLSPGYEAAQAELDAMFPGRADGTARQPVRGQA